MTAQWQKLGGGGETPITIFKILYQAGTDERVEAMPENAEVKQGEDYVISSQLPARAGYLFIGWQADDQAGTVYQANTLLQKLQGDLTLTAKWQAITGLQVLYLAGTAESVQNLPAPAEIEVGSAYIISDLIPVREGYTFSGWLADDEAGTLYQPSDRLTNVQSKLVLTAQWEELKAEDHQVADPETPSQGEPPTSAKAKEKMKILRLLPMTGEVYQVPVLLIIILGGISVGVWCWRKKRNL
ncbi:MULTISPECIES: InlB B-repeat-containing protein [unclassified Enterococcus]|uniref:InlB B-repeat-containing protein n=1 Tax=unclassified Enterococcus TaxID=2608891 RepID=UPI0015528952|nr:MULTISPECIES: InlB B-repeat-containing protein [unclassified Enterococcus]MBS7578057.1 InlB B-repeat-containing protein [Enterococcus sp. MMGLQ5-2]MBS7585253.1 InlB B-repeat-containing protein [Enterococcus sp. MMGLQ5-1]NPD13110.1 hypothetical protein [Enterococcus sp. MMGLQ5-1]NPD37888.1 hypothetical protein [Enterococcus sp. MMGLQ5-2]